MGKRIKEIVIATLAVGAAAVSLYFTFAGRAQKIDAGPYEALGAVTAEETAKFLGNKGQVLVMVADTGAFKNPSVEAELSAFLQALKREREMSVITEKIPATPMQMQTRQTVRRRPRRNSGNTSSTGPAPRLSSTN